MLLVLNEDKRTQLVARSKTAEREKTDGKTRYQKRLKSKVANSVKEYNKLDMNSLFKHNILNISISVKGETDNYLVKISYGTFLDIVREQLKHNGEKLDLRIIIRSLIIAFNRDDVYIHCSCPDWKYRFAYWATKNQIISDSPENRPSNETNPQDKLGPACKHVLLVLSNTSWLIKVASVINNYINYMKKHKERLYADIIYPAIYGKKYEEPVQQDMFDDELATDEETIDTSNAEAREKGRFTKDMFKDDEEVDEPIEDQISLDKEFDDEYRAG